MCKAPFLAAFPGRCPGLLAASNHPAKSIHGSRRLGRIMRSLPELPTQQPLLHQKSPCCNQRRSFIFIFRGLTGKMKWTKFYAKDWSDEVLPFGFFFLFIPRNIYFPAAVHSLMTKPPSWSSEEVAKTTLSLSLARLPSLPRSFQIAFFLPSRSEEFANVLNKMSGYI